MRGRGREMSRRGRVSYEMDGDQVMFLCICIGWECILSIGSKQSLWPESYHLVS